MSRAMVQPIDKGGGEAFVWVSRTRETHARQPARTETLQMRRVYCRGAHAQEQLASRIRPALMPIGLARLSGA